MTTVAWLAGARDHGPVLNQLRSELCTFGGRELLSGTGNGRSQPSEVLAPKWLEELLQGLADAETFAILCCTYGPTAPNNPGCMVLRKMRFETSEEELSLVVGVTHLTTPSNLCRLHLSKSLIGLKSLTFGGRFNRSLERATLPDSLQNLTFGDACLFDQSLERVPRSLQNLTFGACFNQSLERVTLPGRLQSLTFGGFFNQSLERVTLPDSLQNLTFGDDFCQSLERVTLPDGLQSLTFGSNRNQNLQDVTNLQGMTLPGTLRMLRCNGIAVSCL